MTYIEREISASIREAYGYYPVITLTGPRQSGKSTLARHLFPEFRYYNLEEPDVREFAKSDPRTMLNSGAGIILDEVQRAPELLSYVQGIVDEDRQRRLIVTGSAQFSLMKGICQSLAGRTALFELLPLSLSEIKDSVPTVGNEGLTGIDNLLCGGMFPAVRTGSVPTEMYYRNYVGTYLERDLRDVSYIKDLDTFQRFLRLCAGRIGSLFNASELSSELGVSVNTVNAWLNVLQASYIIYMLEPFHVNAGKRLVKSRKLYFTDTGLASWLLRIKSPEQLRDDRMRGHLFENMIVAEALKKQFNRGHEDDLCFYRDSNAVEVDLMISDGSSYNCFEIKSSATYHADFEKSLKSLSEHFPEYVKSQNVIYAGEMTAMDRSPRLLNLSNFYEYL